MDKHSTLLLGTWLHSLGQSWCGAFGSLHTLPIRRSQCVIRAFAASLSLHGSNHPLGSSVSLGNPGHTEIAGHCPLQDPKEDTGVWLGLD